MSTLPRHTRVLHAPPNLGLATREEFREEAAALLGAMPLGEGVLMVDLSRTVTIDSSGLNALVLVQRRAADRRLQVVLTGVDSEIRFLLALTHLESLFRFEPEPR